MRREVHVCDRGPAARCAVSSRCPGAVRRAGEIRTAEAGGEIIRAPPAEKCRGDVSRWRLLFAADWERPEHINILEVRTIVNLARHLARSAGGRHKRTLVFSDSMVAIGVREERLTA